MRVIIGGCGRVGALLANQFETGGNDVVVIDKDPGAFRRLGKMYRGETVRGMIFDRDVLEKSQIARSDAFVAVTSGDNSNVVAATIAREMYRVPKVVARIFDPRRAEIYRRLGIQTVSSVAWASNEIVSLVMFQHTVRDVSLGGGEVQLVRVSIPPRLAGRSVSDLTSPTEIMPVAIVRAGSSFMPTTHEIFQDGDVIEVAVLTSAMSRFESMTNP
ncbi:MAG: TrkA family potassium uptake protein [Coriobacteriia bacterium]|nr:TrkA family potassium uptake protein [Coriobacteriia bacterium]